MAAEVVYLTSTHEGHGQPAEDVVMLLAQYLDMAKRGELIGVGIVGVLGNNRDTVHQCAGGSARRDTMLYSLNALRYYLENLMFQNPESHQGEAS